MSIKGVRAALYKDTSLFMHKSGLLGIVLPLLLVILLSVGISDTGIKTVVQPFQIAVRDQDNTIMSRSLISQIRKVDIFSQVTTLTDETDQEALAAGNVAVITIPHNFFYDMYQTTREDTFVDVRLNKNRKMDTMIFQAVFTSVMDIVHSEWASERSVYLLQYGKLTNDQEISLFYDASDLLLKDALGRQTIFDSAQQIADTAQEMQRRLAATILAVMFLYISAEAVKTLPEELQLGIVPRFQAFGGKLFDFILSKWIMSVILLIPTVILTAVLQKTENLPAYLILMLILQVSAFVIMLTISILTKNSLQTQRWGNLLVLFFAVAGGTIWPDHFLKSQIAWIKYLTLSYYTNIGIKLIDQNETIAGIICWIKPVLLTTVILCLFLRVKMRYTEKKIYTVKHLFFQQSCDAEYYGKRKGKNRQKKEMQDSILQKKCVDSGKESHKKLLLKNKQAGNSQMDYGSNNTLLRILLITKIKFHAVMGGIALIFVTVLIMLLCGMSAGSIENGKTERINIAVVDQDKSLQSELLIQELMKTDAIKILDDKKMVSRSVQNALLNGQIEGILTIGAGYGNSLSQNQERLLHYESSTSALSAQGVREIIAGKVTSQKCRERAVITAESRMKRLLTEKEKYQLKQMITEQEKKLPMYYHMEMEDGGVPSDPFVPQRMSFAAFCTLLLLFTAASWCESPDSKLVNIRLQSVNHGKILVYASDFFALMVFGTGMAFLVMIPYGISGIQFAAITVYVFCCTAIALLLARISVSETRIDAMAPFLALVLSLAGGCFADLSQISGTFAEFSILSPPGGVVSAAAGNGVAFMILLIEGATAVAVNIMVRRW